MGSLLPELPQKKVLKEALSEAENRLVQRSSRDAEDRPPKPPFVESTREKGGRELAVPLGGSACGSSSFMTPASYAKDRFKYEMIDGHRSNTLALAQAIDNVSLADQRAYRHETKGRMAEWMGRDLNRKSPEAIVDRDAAWRKVKTLEEEITGLHELHKELTHKYNESHDSVRRLECSKQVRRARAKARKHFGSYLSEVPTEKKWDGLPWPHDDIGVTDQNVPYYIADGPPPPMVIDAEEEAEPGEVNNADS
ncbi:hypothetical protein Dimus_018110 [Dionaea muscipula]